MQDLFSYLLPLVACHVLQLVFYSQVLYAMMYGATGSNAK